MLKFLYNNVVIETVALEVPPTEVSSAELEDKLAPVYKRLGVPMGTLERLSGIKTRYLWDSKMMPSQAATAAGQRALSKSKLEAQDLDVLISCSVTRDFFEPATAILVHHNLGMKENSIAFDVSNACIGFSDGMIIAANMIEHGAAQAAMVVSGEMVAKAIEHCIRYLLSNPDITRDRLLQLLPTLTLGSTAVAYVLCHKNLAKNGHKLVGAVSRLDSESHNLCVGDADYALCQAEGFTPIMETESTTLIANAAKLGGRTWRDASTAFGWSREQVDHVFCHQIGRQVNEAFYQEMGLDMEKEFTTYRKYGNSISASLPTAFVRGVEEKNIQKGEKILLTAFGSGLNCRFVGIEW